MDACGCDVYATPIEANSDGGATVLDVGDGIGVIDHELLSRGASRAVLVEASPAYLELAREEAGKADLLDRIDIVAADFVRHAGDIEPADIGGVHVRLARRLLRA